MRAQLGGHDRDLVDRRDAGAAAQLGAQRLEQEIARVGDAAADHDSLRPQQHDRAREHAAHVLAGAGERGSRLRVTRPRRRAASATVGCPAAAAIASAPAIRSRQPRLPQPHSGPVRIHGRVADLARVTEPEMEAAVDHHAAADAGAEGDADEIAGAAAGAEPQLRERERADVVDQRDRPPERRADRPRDRAPDPVAEQVRQQRAGAALARRSGPAARARPSPARRTAPHGRAAERGDPLEDRVRPVGRRRRARVGREDARRAAASWTSSGPPATSWAAAGPALASSAALAGDDRGLDVRAAEIEPEMERHRAVHPPSTVSTLPVANGAVAR